MFAKRSISSGEFDVRYQNLKSFRKHLSSAAPHNFCRCYLIAIHDDYERKKAIDASLSAISAPGSAVRSPNIASLLEALQSPSLFGGETVGWIDEAEKLPKNEQQELARFLHNPIDGSYLLVGARGKTAFMNEMEKQGVVLDLLEEKPWEREKRLAEQLEERVQSAGKKLSSDVIPLLFERIGTDAALLDQEIDKLLCFVGERLNIERSDLFRITGASRSHTLWHTADEIVWEKGDVALAADAFHPLIPLLRSQLQLGLKLATLIETKVPSQEWSAYLPKIWPKTLEKRSTQASQKGSAWFRKGLDLLFEIELLSRDGSSQTVALLDLFRLRLLSHG